MDLEVAGLLSASNSNEETVNGTHDVLHDNSDDRNVKISNETHEKLQNKSDKGNTSIKQDFEKVAEAEMSNNSATNDGNSDDFSEIFHHKNRNIAEDQ